MQVLNIKLKVVAGRNLIAKDRAMFGMGARTTSDPFVELCTSNKNVKSWGKTPVISKTLDPTWNTTFPVVTVAVQDADKVRLLFHIFDSDTVGADDPMGTVTMRVPREADSSAKWHAVEKGSGSHSCHNAQGELQIQILSVEETTYTPPLKPKADFVPGGPGHLPSSQTYILAERMFSHSGNTFAVKDASAGHVQFSIKGHAMSTRSRMDVRDAAGKPICIFMKQMFSFMDAHSVWTFSPNFAGQSSESSLDNTSLCKFAEMEKAMAAFSTTLSCRVVRADGRLHPLPLLKPT